MAEERNDTVSGVGAGDTGEIREEIARTRTEMSETIGAIQGRLTPEHLIQQAKDRQQAGNTTERWLTENPLAVGVAGRRESHDLGLRLN